MAYNHCLSYVFVFIAYNHCLNYVFVFIAYNHCLNYVSSWEGFGEGDATNMNLWQLYINILHYSAIKFNKMFAVMIVVA